MIQENITIELKDVSFQVEEVYVVPSTVSGKECYQPQYCEILGEKTVRIRNQNEVSFWNTFKMERKKVFNLEFYSQPDCLSSMRQFQICRDSNSPPMYPSLVNHWSVSFTKMRVKSRKTESRKWGIWLRVFGKGSLGITSVVVLRTTSRRGRALAGSSLGEGEQSQ